MFLTWFLYMLLCLQQSAVSYGIQREIEANLRESMRQTKQNITVEEEENFLETMEQTMNKAVEVEKSLRYLIGQMKTTKTLDKEPKLNNATGQIELNKRGESEVSLNSSIGQSKLNETDEDASYIRTPSEQIESDEDPYEEFNPSVFKDTAEPNNQNVSEEAYLLDSTEHIIPNETATEHEGLSDSKEHIKPNSTAEEKAYLRDSVNTSTEVDAYVHNIIGQIKPNKTVEVEAYLREIMGQIETNGTAELKVFSQDTIEQIEANTTVSVTRTMEFPNMPDPCRTRRRRTNVKDYLCMEPLHFLPSYKNPCWRGQNSRLRCLPYFHLFGMSKSGTTDLFQRLYLHPEIVPNKGLSGKEIVFWTREIFKTGNKSLAYYTNSFFTKEIEKAVDENGYHYKITGHGDPHDMWERFLDWSIPQNDPKAEEMIWTMPYVERHLNPGVKLLLMLRDPVERLYSVFYFARQGNSSAQFDEYVRHDFVLLHNCLKYHTLRHCIFDQKMKDQFKTRMYSSFYAELLRDWLKAFPKDQILILRNEDYAQDIPGTLTKIITFLNVTMPDPKVLDFMTNLPRAHITKKKAEAEPMSRRTRTILTRLYRRSGEELAEMIGDEKFTFKDVQQIHR